MLNLDRNEMQETLLQLDQALYNHEQWSKELIRSLVCCLPFDSRDVVDDAHRQCRFGQWYYGFLPQTIREHPAFMAIENEHYRMHQYAVRLLLSSASSKSCTPQDFDNFINSADRLQLEVSTLKQEIEESLNHRDPLTGAENRTGMLTHLRSLRELVKRGLQECGVVLMDLDHFKSVNDNYGHTVGDQALLAWVNHIKKNLRPYDKVYRYGGEEFLLVFPNTQSQTVFDIVERLRRGMPDIKTDAEPTRSLKVTASFGFTMMDPSINVEESIKRADEAMYAAKKAGRNQCCRWGPEMTSV